MAQFVMIINEVTTEELAKILEIQSRSGEKLRWVSQGHPQSNPPGISSPNMQQAVRTVGNPPKQEVVYNFIRLEWPESSAHFAREILNLFAREEKKESAQAG
jgi:hypothetical protein